MSVGVRSRLANEEDPIQWKPRRGPDHAGGHPAASSGWDQLNEAAVPRLWALYPDSGSRATRLSPHTPACSVARKCPKA